MEKKRFFNLCIVLFLSFSTILANATKSERNGINLMSVNQDNKKISGVVVDELNEPIAGANVTVKGSASIGTITDIDGKFTLSVPANSTLIVSYVGYLTVNILVKNETFYNIQLTEDTQSLEEVVVVGYGTQKKVNLTSAVSSISDKSISTTTGTGVVAKLQGKLPGVNIRQTTGEPGSYSNSINIRGMGTPLFVIDGINREAHDFQRLNSDDIESISVLKDASAAIYGLNAANGVVIVTTKKGSVGKTRFQFDANMGLSTPTNTVRMANSYEFMVMRNDANINRGGEPYISAEELAKYQAGVAGYESTDWYGETFDKYAFRQEYNLSAEGGSDKFQYYVNLNYTDDGSILKTDDINYDKVGFRTNLTAKLTNELKAVVNINAYADEKEQPSYGMFSIWRGTVSSLPFHSPYLDADRKYLARVQDGQSYNPVAISSIDRVGYSRSSFQAYQTNFELSYIPKFLPELELKGILAYDYRFSNGKGLNRTFQMYDYDATTDTYSATNFNAPASMSRSFDNLRNITTQLQANYRIVFAKDHNFGATAVFETRKSDYDYLTVSPKYFDFLTNDEISYASESDSKSSGVKSQTRNMSFLGRLNYDYKGRYLLELSGRYDGSYRYHPDVRWGFFPVASLGWRISEESFLKDNPIISNLKLRASYGTVGQDTGNAFQYISAFSISGGGWYEFTDGKTTNGVQSPALTNESLTWTKNKTGDIGIDLGMFDNKLSITADIFQRDRTGMLATRSATLPNTFGASFPQENLNSNRTRGCEFSITHQNKIENFNYSISANFTYGRTMNRYVEGAIDRVNYLTSYSNYRNDPTNRWNDIAWGYNIIGQFKSEEQIAQYPVQGGTGGYLYTMPGDWIYEDVNGDGVINTDDCVPIRYGGMPIYNYGMTIDMGYKGFDMSVLLQGAAGFAVQYSHAYTTMFWQEGNIPAYFMDRWHKADQYDPNSEWVAGTWPAIRLSDFTGSMYDTSTAWFRNCSYLRIKNVELGYTFNQKFMQKVGLDKIRLFIDITNLYTFADKIIKPFDPEKTSGSYGWDYPLMKSFNFGININF